MPGYDSRRVVIRGTMRRQTRRVDEAIFRTNQGLPSMHSLSYWVSAVLRIGIQLDANRVRIEFVEIDLNLEDEIVVLCLDREWSEPQPCPVLVQLLSPV